MAFESWFNRKKQGEKSNRKVADANIARVLAAGLATATANAEPAHGMESVQAPASITQAAPLDEITTTPAAMAIAQQLTQSSVADGKRIADAFIQTQKSTDPDDFMYDPAQDLYDAILKTKQQGISEELVRYIKDQVQEVNE
jgi:hypothetical protein